MGKGKDSKASKPPPIDMLVDNNLQRDPPNMAWLGFRMGLGSSVAGEAG